ncbi:MAG: DUF5309 family protein [Ignavibacteriales bacterium]|nr:DUF5309 family protein [Ignavibacteriales bacterium]
MAYESINSGVVSSSNMNSANSVPDVEKILYLLKPYQTPLLQYLWFSGRKSKEVRSPFAKFSWFENELYPHQTTNKAAITASGTPASLTLTTSNCNSLTIFNVDDIVLIEETDQMAYVSSRTTSQVVLSHIDGATNLTSIQNEGIYLKIIGSRNTEYSGVRTAMSVKEIEKFNYLNIFSESVATTGRHQAGETYTDGVDHAALVAKKIEEMKLQAERYFLFAPSQGYATSGNYRTTWGHGFLGRIQSNVNSYSPTLDEDTFDDHLKEVFQKGSNRKIHLCGSGQLMEINKFIKTRYELNPNPTVSVYGVNVREYLTPFGSIDLIWNPVMDGKFTNYGFTIDADKVRLRHMAEDKKGCRKFRIEEGVETPGVDGTTTKILMDLGIEIHNEECHGILKMEG